MQWISGFGFIVLTITTVTCFQDVPLPVRQFGARIRPEMITSASNTFGTKSSSRTPPASSSVSSSAFTSPSTPTFGSDSSSTETSTSGSFFENEETFPENSLGEFSRQESTSAAQRSMNRIAEQMKMTTLRQAMAGIKNERGNNLDDSEMTEQETEGNNLDDGEFEEQKEDNDRDDSENDHDDAQGDTDKSMGDIRIAVKSRRKYELAPVHFDRQTDRSPRMIEIVSDTMPLRLHFRSKSSAILVSQSHDPTPMKAIESKVTMDQPYRLAHEVHKPIIQTVREYIQPYRNVIQTLRPVIEDIRTVVPKDSDRLHQHRSGTNRVTNQASRSLNTKGRTHKSPAQSLSGTKSNRNRNDEQMSISTMNTPSWSQLKPILRPPPPTHQPMTMMATGQTMVRPLFHQHLSQNLQLLRSPANRLNNQRPIINGNVNTQLNQAASEHEFVYAVLNDHKGTEQQAEGDSESESSATSSSAGSVIEQVTEPPSGQIDSANRRNDKQQQQQQQHHHFHHPEGEDLSQGDKSNRLPGGNIDSQKHPIHKADYPTSLSPFEWLGKSVPVQHLANHHHQHHRLDHDWIKPDFELDLAGLERIERHHHHVHHQHHHHMHHRVHHRIPRMHPSFTL